jgi:F0F1-type ATP synthase membrane subunit b/b'
VTIASKLIKRNISKEDNDRLIDEALKELEKPRKLAH